MSFNVVIQFSKLSQEDKETCRAMLAGAVRHYADTHYEKGWDIVVECFSDQDIIAVIGGAQTVNGALRKMYQDQIKPHNEARLRHEAAAGV
jgi:hypothetical protein